MKFEIKRRHVQAEIGIPVSARSYIEQAIAGIGQHRPGIHEVQLELVAFRCRLRQDDRDVVVAFARDSRSFYRLVLQELESRTSHFD